MIDDKFGDELQAHELADSNGDVLEPSKEWADQARVVAKGLRILQGEKHGKELDCLSPYLEGGRLELVLESRKDRIKEGRIGIVDFVDEAMELFPEVGPTLLCLGPDLVQELVKSRAELVSGGRAEYLMGE